MDANTMRAWMALAAAQLLEAKAHLTELDAAMATGKTEDQVIEICDGFDVEATLTGDDAAMQRAFDLRKDRLARLSTLNGG